MGKNLLDKVKDSMPDPFWSFIFGVGVLSGVAINTPNNDFTITKFFAESLIPSSLGLITGYVLSGEAKTSLKVGGLLYVGALIGQVISEGAKTYFFN